MTSTWKAPSGRDDQPGGQETEADKNQLDLFEILPRASTGTKQPLAAGSDGDAEAAVLERPFAEMQVAEPRVVKLPTDQGHPEQERPDIAGPGNVETIARPAPTRDLLDVGVSDTEDLRRLEESIRWLMNAGTAPLPRTARVPLPPVAGLSPPDSDDDDSIPLDPDTLFPPRPPRRASPVAAGAAKILLVSAITAPTAYFAASWLQFPAAPSDPAAVAAVAAPVALTGEREQIAALVPTPYVPGAPPDSEPVVPALTAPQAARSEVEVVPVPRSEPAPAPRPASRAADTVVAVVETGPAPAAKAVPEPPSAAAAQPADSAAAARVVPLVKPSLRHEEIAMMVERGRVLFEAGDLAAARLFFRRAASAGDAAAAIAMGATYDPEVLTQRFIRGIEADAEEAQRWYDKARDMGQRVELAQRP
jgi:hypothetical protein